MISSIDSPDPELIEIPCDDHMILGIQIRSSRHRPGIFIHHLAPGSQAEQCSTLHLGDRILEANGHDLKDATVDDAASIIAVSFYLLKPHSERGQTSQQR